MQLSRRFALAGILLLMLAGVGYKAFVTGPSKRLRRRASAKHPQRNRDGGTRAVLWRQDGPRAVARGASLSVPLGDPEDPGRS